MALKTVSLDLPPAAEGRCWLAMVPHGWQKDADATTAIKAAAKRASYVLANHAFDFLLFDAPVDAWVDGIGIVRWDLPAEGATPASAAEVGCGQVTRTAARRVRIVGWKAV